jgi:hypothetical protein
MRHRCRLFESEVIHKSSLLTKKKEAKKKGSSNSIDLDK